jgi:hypothetical protein
MTHWLRTLLTIVAPIIGIFASLMLREWRDDILHAFPFVIAHGPISARALVFWALVAIPVVAAAWQWYSTQRGERDKRARREQVEMRHASAVSVSLTRGTGDVSLWSSNRSTHLIRGIQIVAIPDDEEWMEERDGPLPAVQPSHVSGVSLTYPIAGGWFYATMDQLNPGRGLQVLKATLRAVDFTRIDFDVAWLDHEGLQRKSHGTADVRVVEGEIALRPRPTPLRSNA